MQAGWGALTAAFSISGTFSKRGSGEGEMAARWLPAQVQVSEGFLLELPSRFRASSIAELL